MSNTSVIKYTISDLATEFEITPRSLRFYEAEGLLTPTRQGLTRIYSRQDRTRLQLILRGKRLGFSLSEIKTLFHWYDSPKNNRVQIRNMQNLIEDKKILLKQQLNDIHIILNELNHAENICIKAANQITKK
ncbi:MAG: MerR family transcriptional regulator [Plesiomonas sp.]|uniref:MerR family transcriptional regulator n=1 Tax=Plesiomonas sp. TaxID=2486279 RepID=UPI003F396BE2